MEINRPESNQPLPPHAKKVYSGKLFDVYQWEQEMYDGTTAIFEKLKRPDTVVIYPVLPDGRILLTKEEQPGMELRIGTPGGRVDEGESPVEAAQRELLEETGYEAKELILWDVQQPVSKIDWAIYTFIAKGLAKVAEPHLDGGEKIELMPVSFDEALDIATQERFVEKAMLGRLLEAKYEPTKREQLRALFQPSA